MSRYPTLLLVIAAAAVGCKGKAQPAGGPTPVTVRDAGAVVAVGDAAAGDVDDLGAGTDPDEATLRAGKRTGLGGPDEPPEVATEALIEAIVGGTVPWSRFVDPSRGVVELRLPADRGAASPVARRCGAGLTTSLDALTAAMKAAATGGLGYALDCDNLGLVVPDPGGAPAAATCSLESPAAGTIIVDLVFVPDAARGLRLVGFSTVPEDADAPLPVFEAEMAGADARCP